MASSHILHFVSTSGTAEIRQRPKDTNHQICDGRKREHCGTY